MNNSMLPESIQTLLRILVSVGKLHSLYVFRGFRGCSEWCCKQCFKRKIEIKWSSCLDFASPQDLKSVREKHPLQYSPCSSLLSIAQSFFTQEYTITQIFFIHMLYVSYWIFKYCFVFNGHMEAWLFSYFHKMLTSHTNVTQTGLQNVKKCRLAQGFCAIRDIFVVENGHLYYYIIALLILCGVEAKIFKNKSYILLSNTCSSLLKPRLSFKGFFLSQQLLI